MRAKRVTVVALAAMITVGVFGAVFAFGGASNGGSTKTPLFATLNGATEVDATGAANAGDPNGYGGAAVSIQGSKVCVGITVAKIGAVGAAHIHKGAPGANGAVVVDFKLAGNGNPGAMSACVGAKKGLAKDISKNPGKYYVNVHTGAFPAGAIRGQLG